MLRITLELTDIEGTDLALWLRRLHFGDFEAKTDAGQSQAERIEQAYRFRDAAVKVEDAVALARNSRSR
jgi:hypothetical protein